VYSATLRTCVSVNSLSLPVVGCRSIWVSTKTSAAVVQYNGGQARRQAGLSHAGNKEVVLWQCVVTVLKSAGVLRWEVAVCSSKVT
jgi:hypothetical protein